MQGEHAEIRVLHVDDEPDFAELTRTFLERADEAFAVRTARDADEALDRLAEADFDCIVSDYDMPGRNGIDLLGEVREQHADLPFILFTSEGSETVASEAISAGVTDYLQKSTAPEQYELLATRITTAVGQYRAERELERQTDLFQKAQDIANVGAWEYEVGAEGGVYVTDEVRRIHGLAPGEDLTPVTSFDYYHEDDVEAVEAAFRRAVEEGESYDLEVRLVTDDGDLRWVRTRGEPQTEDGETVRVRGTLSDITDQKLRERRLERQNQRLEDLAHVISHDIRTPLQLAMGQREIAQRTGDEEAFRKLAAAHERIEALTEDILSLAKQGLSIGDLESVDLDQIAREALAAVDEPALTLRSVGDIRTEADPDRLQQLFENLFRNAVEHGPADGDAAAGGITVSIGPLEPFPTSTRGPSEHSFGFYVADDGRGIPEDERDTVFDPGYSTAGDGTGFGLAIVEEIVRAHGWSISVTESRDGGARFEIVG